MSIQRIATKEGHRSFSKTDKCLESKSLFQFPSELGACFEVQQRRQVHTGAIQNYLSIGSSILEDGWKLLSRIVYNTHIFPYHHLLISSLIIVSKLPQQLSRCLPKKLRIQCCCWPRKQAAVWEKWKISVGGGHPSSAAKNQSLGRFQKSSHKMVRL